MESRYSGTASENLHGDSQGSFSLDTSEGDGEASVSTQSIEIVPYQDFFEDANPGATLVINDQGGADDTGNPGGVTWTGDADEEYIFGTSWNDSLYGDAGDDIMYGFEGDDEISGGYGVDRLFGDAGDDTIFLGTTVPITRKPEIYGAGTEGE